MEDGAYSRVATEDALKSPELGKVEGSNRSVFVRFLRQDTQILSSNHLVSAMFTV
jgi:hypothetical protein